PQKEVTTLEGTTQVISRGPVASQEAIKQLGTNGGGFFNANAAHPFENPNAVTNFFSMFLIFLIPAGLTYTFGRMARDQRQGWALFGAMAFLFFCGVVVAYWAESAGNPIFHGMPVAQAGNLEGKEVRFGIANSALAFIILAFTGWPSVVPYGLSSLNNAGPHGLTEMLYAYSSGAGNNGSAFAGLNANTPFYNTTLGLDMLFGRFWMILPALALAGSLAGKKVTPPGPGTLPPNGPLFVALLVGVIVIV